MARSLKEINDNWIYECIDKKDHTSPRFVLGEKGNRPLVCFGVNPSTAIPGDLDLTLTQVQRKAKLMGFDGWIMFNLYPQRATNINEMDDNLVHQIHKINILNIKKAISKHHKPTVWAAWGGLIEKRTYLGECLKDIVKVMPASAKWVHVGPLVAKKHPHHPLYLRKDLGFNSFNINQYLSNIGKLNE